MKTKTITHKQTLYKTAVATISCRAIKAGQWVGVQFSYTAPNGVDWYVIHKTEAGPLPAPIYYPAHHLERLCL